MPGVACRRAVLTPTSINALTSGVRPAADTGLLGMDSMYPRALRSAVTAALGAVLAAAVLSGCSTRSAQPDGSLGGSPAARPSNAPAASAAPVATASLPADFEVDFDLDITGSQDQVELLTQAKALVLAYEQAIERNDPKDPLYKSMVSGLAEANLAASITGYQTAQQRPTGVLDFDQFTTKVNPVAADVLFCENRAQVKLVNFKTGASIKNEDTGEQHWDIGFNHGSNDTWTIAYISALTVTAGSSQCT
jgi:hypothetical protein